MNLAVGPSGASGPAEWITILVAGIAAAAAVIAAIVAALSARSTKQLELRAQRTRELESRISERKIDVYKPMIELLGNVISNAAHGIQTAPEETTSKIAEFTTWITIYGADETVRTYHNFMQAAFNQAPMLVTSRLYAELILASRRDIGYPDTSVTALQIMGMRVNDLYSEAEYRHAMDLPFEELCRQEKWSPPWMITSKDAKTSLPPDNAERQNAHHP
jgi:hypothetical protein